MSNELYYEEFTRLAALTDSEIDLGHAAFLIAGCEYPNLDIRSYMRRLDMLAAGVAERMPGGAKPLQQLQVLNNFLFNQRRFRGNSENYYDSRNSYLNDVLDRRIGIPITLSVVYMEIARRINIPIRGVGLPGHFVVCYDAPGINLFIDSFHGGRLLSSDDCHEMVFRALGTRQISFGHFLQPVSNRAILTRILTNLKVIYLHQGDTERTVRVLNQIILLNPMAMDEFKERGLIHLASQCYRAALVDLTTYLERCPNAPDAQAIHHRVDMICATLGTSWGYSGNS